MHFFTAPYQKFGGICTKGKCDSCLKQRFLYLPLLTNTVITSDICLCVPSPPPPTNPASSLNCCSLHSQHATRHISMPAEALNRRTTQNFTAQNIAVQMQCQHTLQHKHMQQNTHVTALHSRHPATSRYAVHVWRFWPLPRLQNMVPLHSTRLYAKVVASVEVCPEVPSASYI